MSDAKRKKSQKLKLTKESAIKLLYQLMYDTHQILVNNGIKYWIDGGTLLGAVRHNGIIPWDDDLDIGMIQKDIKKFLAIESDFNKCGYSICKVWLGYKIYYTNRKPIVIDGEEECYSFPFIDVFPYRKFPDGKYRLSLKAAREAFPKEVWSHDDLYPLVEYEFGAFNVLGPNKAEPYFVNYYGKDWNKIAYREYDHEVEESVEVVKVKLTKEMREPAMPIDKIKDRRCVKACLKLTSKKLPESDYWKKKDTKSCSVAGGCYNNFAYKMGVYVINCAMHKSRYNKFKKYAAEAGVKACRIPCVLGTKFDQNLMCKMIKDKVVSPTSDMTTIEISINMSHYNAWQKLVNSCKEYALILEDDVELKPDFVQNLDLIMDKLADMDMDFSLLFLWAGHWSDNFGEQEFVAKVKKGINIMQEVDKYNNGAAAYIISRKYAEFLMKKFFPIKMPQDIMMGSYPHVGNHLCLEMKYRDSDSCFLSPLLDMECGGAGGTGTQTTQEHSAPTVDQRWSCNKCKV